MRPIPLAEIEPRLPYEVPPKIWCIGLNYKSHAEDIDAVQPEEPGSFMKPASCMFQPGGDIVLPPPEVSDDVDAEGELAVIIGRSCRFVPVEKAREVIYGFTTTLDLTALDVLRKNPRYLTRAKSIDTFFSFGPVIVTADEVPDIDALEIITEHNGARLFARFRPQHEAPAAQSGGVPQRLLHSASGRHHFHRLSEGRAHQAGRYRAGAHRRRGHAERQCDGGRADAVRIQRLRMTDTLVLAGLKRLILWDYPRGVWQYDVMCGVILVFIAFAPREWFRDQPRIPHASQITSLPGHGEGVFWIEPELVSSVPEAQRLDVSE